MHLLYNNQLILEQELKLPLTNRAFQYNDDFFETIMVVNGRLRFWENHFARIQEAANSLKLNLPEYFNQTDLEKTLLSLAENNGALTYGRLKLKVWRAGAGLYTPDTNEIEWLATAYTSEHSTNHKIDIGICQNIKTVYSPLSHFKGPNAPIYTLAGVEKKDTGYDDMLLLNAQGIVSELISSNVFWLLGEKLYTPALDTGCVNGIARRNILSWCRKNSIDFKEAYFTPNRLFEVHTVFAANVTGIRPIKSIADNAIDTNEDFVRKISTGIGF